MDAKHHSFWKGKPRPETGGLVRRCGKIILFRHSDGAKALDRGISLNQEGHRTDGRDPFQFGTDQFLSSGKDRVSQ